MSEVEPYRTINNEVDVAKKCYQVWQKVAKVAKKCYQMWQNVAKGVQKVPRGSKLFQGFEGVPKGKCYQMWQKVAKGVPKVVQGRPTLFAKAYGLERLPAVLARRASAAGAP